MIRLGPEWTQLFEQYEHCHSDARNRICHELGHPAVAAGIAAVMFGALVEGVGLLLIGIFAQTLGHRLEGSRPPSFRDGRFLLIGWIWWLDNRGLEVQKAQKDEIDLEK